MSKHIAIALQCPICNRIGTVYIQRSSGRPSLDRENDLAAYNMPRGFVEVYRAMSLRGKTFDVECVEHAVSAVSGGNKTRYGLI